MKILMGIVVVMALCIGASSAEAARGIAIINTGEDIVHVSNLKEDVRADVESKTAPGAAVGLMYSRFGVFWLDLWRWDGQFVLYKDDNVWQVPEEELGAMAAGALSKPITYRLPPGLIIVILAVVGVLLFALLGRRKSAAAESPEPAYHP